jgi:hypothetical protein
MKKARPNNPMLTNKEGADLCCLSVITLNHYRLDEKHADKGLVEGIHWQSVNGRAVRWYEVPLEHWRDHRHSIEALEIHRKWLEKWIASIGY